tara:strand:- start:277 stop:558 length:282 start_codon:yes stop_codon:yes gene_type:complete
MTNNRKDNMKNNKKIYLSEEDKMMRDTSANWGQSSLITNKKVNKQMMNYWLDDNYQTWIADILVSLVNDDNPNALINLRKEITDAWDQRSEVN